jgi:hypothetical protein
MQVNWKRFKKCKECERNASVGFAGPPECDLKLQPDDQGNCPSFTTEIADTVFQPTVQVGTESLRSLLAILQPVAERARFNKVIPLAVGVASGNVAFRVSDGETNVVASLKESIIQQMVHVTFEDVQNAIPADSASTTIALDGQTLKVHGRPIPALADRCPQLDREWPTARGQKKMPTTIPQLDGTTAFLTRALHSGGHAVLQHVLVELPAFTCVATDGKRVHVRRPMPVQENPSAAILLTRHQLQWVWTADLEEKAIVQVSGTCWKVTGRHDAWSVVAAMDTPTGEFPKWRQFFEVQYPENQVRNVPIAELRTWAHGDGIYHVADVVPVEKGYLSDAIAAWPDEAVEVCWKTDKAPVILIGSDRSAVIVYAVAAAAPEKVARRKVTTAQPLPPPVQPPAEENPIRFPLRTPITLGTGEQVEIVKYAVYYLVRGANGTHWFSEAGLVNRLPKTEGVGAAA